MFGHKKRRLWGHVITPHVLKGLSYGRELDSFNVTPERRAGRVIEAAKRRIVA